MTTALSKIEHISVAMPVRPQFVVRELFNLDKLGALIMPQALDSHSRQWLLSEARRQKFKRYSKSLVVEHESVYQDFYATSAMSPTLHALVNEFSDFYRSVGDRAHFIPGEINSASYFRFEPESGRITSYQPPVWHINMTALFALEGELSISLGTRRNERLVEAILLPGDVLLTRGVRRVGGQYVRPFMSIDGTDQRRYVAALHHTVDNETLIRATGQ